MERAVFLDIDDVLLTARALVLSNNRRFLRANGLAVDARLVTFDPIGIEMLNRIAELTDARFVLSTSWRHTVGVELTLEALQRNGLSGSKLHADPYCPLTGSRIDGVTGKARDIRAWLALHKDVEAWVAIDNAPSLAVEMRATASTARGLVIEVDPLVGISARDYSLALQHLGTPRDPDLISFKAFHPSLEKPHA